MSKRSINATSKKTVNTSANDSCQKRRCYEDSGPGQYWKKLRPYLEKASKEEVEDLAEDLFCELWNNSGQISASAAISPFWSKIKEKKDTIVQALDTEKYEGPLPSQLKYGKGDSSTPPSGDSGTQLPLATSSKEQEMLALLEAKRKSPAWPHKRYRAGKFSIGSLNSLRLHQSEAVNHKPVLIKRIGNQDPKFGCALCSLKGNRRKTRYECAVCEVALCITVLPGEPQGADTHFQKWHAAADLKLEHKRCRQQLLEGRKKGWRSLQVEDSGNKDKIKDDSEDKEMDKDTSEDKDTVKDDSEDKEIIKDDSEDREMVKDDSEDREMVKDDSGHREVEDDSGIKQE